MHMSKTSMKWLSLLLLLQLTWYFSSGSCGKVLVWPVEFSHWMIIETILNGLVSKGPEVTVLISSAFTLTDSNKPSVMKFEIYLTSLTKDDLEDSVKLLINKWMLLVKDFFWIDLSTMQSLFWEFSDIGINM